jgi:hypothetical protein
MGEQALARILGILACAGFIWVGIGFAGFALTTAIAPRFGLAGAAGITAAALLIVPIAVSILFGRSRSNWANSKDTDSVLSAIAVVARERPVLAMLGAAAFGAAEVLLNTRGRKEKK